MARRRPAADHTPAALFLAEGADTLALDAGPGLTTTPIDELDLPRELAPGVIAYPSTPADELATPADVDARAAWLEALAPSDPDR